ncbi:MAG: hypothetical protein ACOC2N_02415 [Spirochaetota bacterium]
MADIVEMIRRDIEDDVSIEARGLIVDIDRKGVLVKHDIVRVSGSVSSEQERDKIREIVDHHAGSTYKVDFNVSVKEATGA